VVSERHMTSGLDFLPLSMPIRDDDKGSKTVYHEV
jgi:hypothetical protein